MLKQTAVFGGFAALLACWSGCGPSSIELHHEQAGETGSGGAPASMPAAETGGSSATSGESATSGGSAAGGTGGSTAGSGSVFAPTCDYVGALKSCNALGCHARAYAAAGLNLVADAGLVSRLKDIPATFADIVCAPNLCETPPAACPPAGTTLLVNSADWQQSWMIRKMRDEAPGCGDTMPDGQYLASGDQACLEQMVQAIAALPN